MAPNASAPGTTFFLVRLQRGSQAGSELDDWLRAEAGILRAVDAAIDEASEESFSASDAPAY
jgi:Protein of unknown function (DUF2934)